MNNGGFKGFLASSLGRIVVTVISAIIIYGLIIAGISSNTTSLSVIVMLVCCFFGWRALNRITPDIFLFMSITGWIIYFVVKGMISVAIGAFIAPFYIGKWIANLTGDIASN